MRFKFLTTKLLILMAVVSVCLGSSVDISQSQDTASEYLIVFSMATDDDFGTSDKLGILDTTTGTIDVIELGGLYYDDLGLLTSSKGDILYRNREGVNIIQSNGDIHTLDLDIGTFGSYDWSPDGRYLAFIDFEEQNLYIADWQVDSIQQIQTALFPAGALEWSPGGNQIAFNSAVTRSNEEVSVVAILDVESNEVWQAEASGSTAFPKWSPDESRMLVSDDKEGNIYVINVDADEKTLLDRGYGAQWVDNNTIFYIQYMELTEYFDFKIFTLDSSSSETLFRTRLIVKGAVISPDKQQLLYGFEHRVASEVSTLCIYNFDQQTSFCFHDIPMSVNGGAAWLPR